MKKILIFTFALIILAGLTTALTTDLISIDSFDSKLTTIYTSSFCLISTKCDIKTPTEINVDFAKDSKTGSIKVDYAGVLRSG